MPSDSGGERGRIAIAVIGGVIYTKIYLIFVPIATSSPSLGILQGVAARSRRCNSVFRDPPTT